MSRARGPAPGGFSLLEIVIGAAVFVLVLAVLMSAMSGARRSEDLSTLYLNLMEGVALAIHQVRTDLRQLAFVPDRPVVPYSLSMSQDQSSLLMRRSSAAAVRTGTLGSSFVLVEYGLVGTGRPSGGYHLVRREQTASGAALPGRGRASDETVFRSFTLDDARYVYQEIPAADDRVLKVALFVRTDSGREGKRGPLVRKVLAVTNVLQVQRPEPSWGPPSFFAEAITIPAERPPGDVLAPPATHAGRLPVPGDGPAGGPAD